MLYPKLLQMAYEGYSTAVLMLDNGINSELDLLYVEYYTQNCVRTAICYKLILQGIRVDESLGVDDLLKTYEKDKVTLRNFISEVNLDNKSKDIEDRINYLNSNMYLAKEYIGSVSPTEIKYQDYVKILYSLPDYTKANKTEKELDEIVLEYYAKYF